MGNLLTKIHGTDFADGNQHSISQRFSSTPTLGLDTEFLIRRDGAYVWPHQSDCPQERPVYDRANHNYSNQWGVSFGDMHGDGYAWELCVTPSTCIEGVCASVGETLKYALLGPLQDLEARVNPKYKNIWEGSNNDLGLEIETPVLYEVPVRVARTAPPEVGRLGCAPSLNVYGDAAVPTGLSTTTRTLGCHLHIGHAALSEDFVANNLIKWSDLLVGNTWTALFMTEPDAERQRRACYGRAGEHRRTRYQAGAYNEKTYGVEYRVLPGGAARSPVILSMLFALYRAAANCAARAGEPPQDLVQQARLNINNANQADAVLLMDSLDWPDQSKKCLDFYKHYDILPRAIERWYPGADYLFRNLQTKTWNMQSLLKRKEAA